VAYLPGILLEAVVLVAGALYALGGRLRPARAAAFYGGLAVLLAALVGPLDDLAQRSFAAHMTQHVLILTVAPPLILLGSPWPRVWGPLPRTVRVPASRALVRTLGPHGRAALALALAAAALGIWHVPALYDAAVRHPPLHALEHLTLFATALAFWAHVIDVPPLRSRLDDLHRAGYLAAALVPGWILAIVLAFAPAPLYAAYAHGGQPWGLSPLADQQLAAGVMWVPGSIAYTVALVLAVYRWLGGEARPHRPEELSWT
jgi:cytochrome c oxidase assembly factor CtaG